MSDTELEAIAAAAEHLAINHTTGAYHKPVALVWAIDRAIRGRPRLVTAAVARAELDPILEELTGATSNAAWPWLKLANDLGPAWSVDGADPTGSPPVNFVAGWSRTAYTALSGHPVEARQLIDFLIDRYFGEVRDDGSLRFLQTEPGGRE